MGRLRNTLELAKTSWTVLKKDRELLWFPVMSFLASIVVIVVFAIPTIAISETTDSVSGVLASPREIRLGGSICGRNAAQQPRPG